MRLADYWAQLDGPVHPEDEIHFSERPGVEALLQTNFIPSPYFGDVVFQRWRLWGVERSESPGVLFAEAPASPRLSKASRDKIVAFLRHSSA